MRFNALVIGGSEKSVHVALCLPGTFNPAALDKGQVFPLSKVLSQKELDMPSKKINVIDSVGESKERVGIPTVLEIDESFIAKLPQLADLAL